MVILVSSPGYRTLLLASEKNGILIQVIIRANIYGRERILEDTLPLRKHQVGRQTDAALDVSIA